MDGLLAAAREVLGMELAYLAEVRESELVLREVDGDIAAYGGVAPGFTLPRELLVVPRDGRGRAPQLVRDAAAIPQAAAHPFVAATGIRAYAGVPVRRADGSLYGSLCCLSRAPQPQLGERDLRYLDVLARMAAERLAAAEGAQLRPPRRGRGGRRPGAAGRAERARELHGRALRGGARAGAGGGRRARRWTARTRPPSARSRCCTTSARSACRTRSCRSPGG